MNSQDLETARRLDLDLVVVVLNDGGYGMIKWKQGKEGFDDFGLDFGNPDFVMQAQSYGASGHRVGSAGELIPLLENCLKDQGVHVIEVPVDYSINSCILPCEIKDLSEKQ